MLRRWYLFATASTVAEMLLPWAARWQPRGGVRHGDTQEARDCEHIRCESLCVCTGLHLRLCDSLSLCPTVLRTSDSGAGSSAGRVLGLRPEAAACEWGPSPTLNIAEPVVFSQMPFGVSLCGSFVFCGWRVRAKQSSVVIYLHSSRTIARALDAASRRVALECIRILSTTRGR